MDQTYALKIGIIYIYEDYLYDSTAECPSLNLANAVLIFIIIWIIITIVEECCAVVRSV